MDEVDGDVALAEIAREPLGETGQIADTVVLLVSPRSATTTGSEFVVDCGWIKAT